MPFLARSPLSPRLHGIVEQLWWYAGDPWPHRYERLLPSGKAQLLVNLAEDGLRTYERVGGPSQTLSGACSSGVHQAATILDTMDQRDVMGVVLSPVGAAALFGSAEAVANAHVDLGALWGRAGVVVRERLLEADGPAARLAVLERVVAEQLVGDAGEGARIERAIAGLHRGVRALCADLGTTERTFRRHFRRHVGLPPKRYARVTRLGRVLRAVEAGTHRERGRTDWAGLALDAGFYDQAHLTQDFGELAGITPTAYRPRSPGEIHHVVAG